MPKAPTTPNQLVAHYSVAAFTGGLVAALLIWLQFSLMAIESAAAHFVLPTVAGALVGLAFGHILKGRAVAQRAARCDTLTGLPNRSGLSLAVEAEVARSERYGGTAGLLMFDVDKFKSINDTHGHGVGDEVLVGLTEAVRSVTRRTDVFARWAGDEFVVLAPRTGTAGCRALAEKIRQAVVNYPMPLDLDVTISIGVAHYVAGDDEASMLKRADEALYRAKRAGRNCTASSRFLRSTGTFTRAR